MAVKKLAWAVTYANAAGKSLRNEYETEAQARSFAARKKKQAMEEGLTLPRVDKLKPHRWEAGYQDNQGRWKTKRFKLQSEAQSFVEEQTRAVRNRTYVDPRRAQETTVAELYQSWIQRIQTVGSSGRKPANPKTVQGYEWIYRRLIGPTWSDFPLGNIRYQEVSQWAQSMRGVTGAVASPNARARAVNQFSRMLNYAVSQQLLAFNPAKDASGGRDYVPEAKKQRSPVYLSMRQLERLASCCGQYEPMVRFTGLTGLRWGEVTALQVKDLDLGPRPCVVVERAYAEVNGGLVLGETKGHESREIPLPTFLADELMALTEGKVSSGLVFTSANGRPLRNSNFTRRIYSPARDTAGSAVALLQAGVGASEYRKGLAYFGPATASAVRRLQEEAGLEPTGLVEGALWRLVSANMGIGKGAQRTFDGVSHLQLCEGDMDFRPPVFHDLRHTAVSLYLSVTKNVKHVQRIAGHKDATTTLNTYAELFDDDFYESASGLEKLRAG